jgi:peptidoglycan/LPS O-acetylase OafA/YrhL
VDFFAHWPPVLILAALFGLVTTPLFKAADGPPIPTRKRISTLDGLRGFLALSVFFHHAAIFHSYIQGEPWGPPPDRLYALLGPLGVAMFFMITGFLFWGQLIDKNGSPSWIRLYIGRIFRLGPLYLVAISAVFVVAFAATDFQIRERPARIAFEIVSWAAPLGFHIGPPINGYSHASDLIGVIWSLRYEWLFYASLAVTWIFARNSLLAWLFPTTALVTSLAVLLFPIGRIVTTQAPFIALFAIGMLTAALRPLGERLRLGRWAFSILAGTLLLVVLCLFDTAYTVLPICMLGVAFFLIANGCSLFDLLNTRAARRLGNISYGLYLLQLLIIAGALALAPIRQFAVTTPLGYWLVTAATAAALVIIATACHALVERPGIDAGRRLLELVARQQPPAAVWGARR